MAKKIADMASREFGDKHVDGDSYGCNDLISHAMSLPDPNGYYHGHRLEGSKMPDNILLFVRSQSKQLGITERRSFHNRNVLLIPLRGSARIIVNARTYELEVGNCLHIAPYQFHHYSDIQRDGFCWLFITFECAGERETQGDICCPTDTESFTADLRQMLLAYLAPKTSETSLQLVCRLSLLLINLQRLKSARRRPLSPNHSEDLLLRVHALLSKNFHQFLSVAEISHKIGMSESSLRSQFRNASGYSLGRFQQTLHLQHAALLLNEKPHMSVAQVAEACGWESPYAFSRAFSKHWELPPKKFSKQSTTVLLSAP